MLPFLEHPLIADEIYHGITYEQPASTVLELDPNAVVINGFEVLLHDRLAPGIDRSARAGPPDRAAAQNLFISPPALAQEAALAALSCREELDQRVETYRRSRDACWTACRAADSIGSRRSTVLSTCTPTSVT